MINKYLILKINFKNVKQRLLVYTQFRSSDIYFKFIELYRNLIFLSICQNDEIIRFLLHG